MARALARLTLVRVAVARQKLGRLRCCNRLVVLTPPEVPKAGRPSCLLRARLTVALVGAEAARPRVTQARLSSFAVG